MFPFYAPLRRSPEDTKNRRRGEREKNKTSVPKWKEAPRNRHARPLEYGDDVQFLCAGTRARVRERRGSRKKQSGRRRFATNNGTPASSLSFRMQRVGRGEAGKCQRGVLFIKRHSCRCTTSPFSSFFFSVCFFYPPLEVDRFLRRQAREFAGTPHRMRARTLVARPLDSSQRHRFGKNGAWGHT